MYKHFYLMEKDPFESHPSPDIFFESRAHERGWQYLLQGIAEENPLLLVTGEYGAGKTLLCLRLLERIRKGGPLATIFIADPGCGFPMILTKILNGLDIGVNSVDEMELQTCLYHYLETDAGALERTIYLVIDDVQECNYAVLNKLRMLASYNHMGHFPFKLILFGHRKIINILNRHLVPLRQRIRKICDIPSLRFEEVKEYIYFRLIHSGAGGVPVFDDPSIVLIHSISRGVPRLINNICDGCLSFAARGRSDVVDAEMVEAWAKSMRLSGDVSEGVLRQLPSAEKKKERVSSEPEDLPVASAEGLFKNWGDAPLISVSKWANFIPRRLVYIVLILLFGSMSMFYYSKIRHIESRLEAEFQMPPREAHGLVENMAEVN